MNCVKPTDNFSFSTVVIINHFLSKIILTESGSNGDSKLDLVGMQHPWAVSVFGGNVCCEKKPEMSKKEGALAKVLI